MARIFWGHGANPCPSPLLPYLLQLARGVDKRTAIQLPGPRHRNKSRASLGNKALGFCGVYLLGFVSAARRRPVANISR